MAGCRWRPAVAMVAVALFLGGAAAREVGAQTRLTLRFRGVPGGEPAACRLHVSGPDGPLFATPDAALRTHVGVGFAPFVLAEDSLALWVQPGTYHIRAVQGTTGIPVEFDVAVHSDTVVTVGLARWIDPRSDGWIAGDPHVHPSHPPSEYPTAGPEVAAAAARAEALEVVALLANAADTPSGPVAPAQPGVSLVWGEEYRSGYWGHVVLLGLPQLLLTPYGAGCCGVGQPAWPTLRAALEPTAAPLAIVAHPYTTDDMAGAGLWPWAGLCRELPALALGDVVHGIAVASSGNIPDGWALREFRDGLAMGAHWAAIGESDMTLDRFGSGPPGWARTYALLDEPAPPGTPELSAQWEAAVRAGRTFATQGPVVRELRIAGRLPGETATLPAPGPVQVRLRAASWLPMQAARVHGVAGVVWSAQWAQGRTSLDTTFTVVAASDDALFVELSAAADRWYAPVDTARAVTTPVWVTMGQPWPVPAATARRAVDRLTYFWNRSLTARGYPAPPESTQARAELLGAAALYETVVDDAPGPFALLEPAPGSTLPTTAATLRWRSAPSYDGDAATYRVLLDTSPLFPTPEEYDAGSDTSKTLADLSPGQAYWWRVQAHEPGEPPRSNEPPDGSFVVSAFPLDAPQRVRAWMELSTPSTAPDGSLRVSLSLAEPAVVRTRWVDMKGRAVTATDAGWRSAGVHSLVWDARDARGRPVAAGVYWIVAEAGSARAARRVALLRR